MNKWVIIIAVFLCSFIIRLWNLNSAGRTWDESAYVNTGYKFIELIKHGDFNNKFWYDFPDHPPLAKYFYGIGAHFDLAYIDKTGQPIFQYDWIYSRFISVFFSSLSVAVVVLFGYEFISVFVGIVAGLVLSLLPIFIGLSQLVTIESVLIFFFTAAVYIYCKLLRNFSKIKLIISGVLLGCALSVKFTNIFLIPLFILICFIYILFHKRSSKTELIFQLLLIICISLITYFVLWPGMWFHAQAIMNKTSSLRFSYTQPFGEYIFGSLRKIPLTYYFIYFFTTTPLFVLVLFFVGFWKTMQRKNWIYFILITWFLLPFIQSFYPMRQNGIRYIIEIYSPLSLITAIGLEFVVSRYSKKNLIKILYTLPFFIYLLIINIKISPYYLDFFNILVGGTKGVYENKTFNLEYWGEGQREAAAFLNQNGFQNMNIGIQVVPKYLLPPVEGMNYYFYNSKHEYDFVVVNYLSVLKDKFDEKTLNQKYTIVYSVMADSAPIVNIYRHR